MTSLMLGLVGVGPLCSSTTMVAQSIKASFRESFPATFGKTHFIVGQTADQREALRSQRKGGAATQATPLGAPIAVLFSPDDDIRAFLIDLIEHEQEHIAVAVFVFTDTKIARALIDACKRGVVVELVTDSTGIRDRFTKIRTLANAQIPVFVYDIQHGKPGLGSVMHNKFVIFRKNKNNQPCVCTGSCNLTRSAFESNQENIIVFTDRAHVERFVHRFKILKERSYQHANDRLH